jgi:integrase
LIPAEISKNRKDEVVTVSDDLKELFLELKIDQFPGGHYLFSDDLKPGKKHRHSKQFNDHWDKMKKVLKLPKQYQFYSLKDTGITNLFRSGLDSISIRDQARHYNISITDTYTPKDIQEANEKIKSNTKKF